MYTHLLLPPPVLHVFIFTMSTCYWCILHVQFIFFIKHLLYCFLTQLLTQDTQALECRTHCLVQNHLRFWFVMATIDKLYISFWCLFVTYFNFLTQWYKSIKFICVSHFVILKFLQHTISGIITVCCFLWCKSNHKIKKTKSIQK